MRFQGGRYRCGISRRGLRVVANLYNNRRQPMTRRINNWGISNQGIIKRPIRKKPTQEDADRHPLQSTAVAAAPYKWRVDWHAKYERECRIPNIVMGLNHTWRSMTKSDKTINMFLICKPSWWSRSTNDHFEISPRCVPFDGK